MVDFFDKCSARNRVRVEQCESTEVIERTLMLLEVNNLRLDQLVLLIFICVLL